MRSVFTSAAAKDAAKLMAVVVFPTPPFWLATAMTRPINCRGARAVGRIVRFAFKMQGRIARWRFNLCAKRVQCSSRNTQTAFRGSKLLECSGWNIERVLDGIEVPNRVGKMSQCSDWNIRSNVPVGTLRLVFRLEHYPSVPV